MKSIAVTAPAEGIPVRSPRAGGIEVFPILSFADILHEERLREFNKCHHPSGAKHGGQFCTHYDLSQVIKAPRVPRARKQKARRVPAGLDLSQVTRSPRYRAAA